MHVSSMPTLNGSTKGDTEITFHTDTPSSVAELEVCGNGKVQNRGLDHDGPRKIHPTSLRIGFGLIFPLSFCRTNF